MKFSRLLFFEKADFRLPSPEKSSAELFRAWSLFSSSPSLGSFHLYLRARVLVFGLGSGSGLGIFVSEPVGLLNFAIKHCAMSRIYTNLCARAYSGLQKSPRALERFRPGLNRAWPRPVPALAYNENTNLHWLFVNDA